MIRNEQGIFPFGELPLGANWHLKWALFTCGLRETEKRQRTGDEPLVCTRMFPGLYFLSVSFRVGALKEGKPTDVERDPELFYKHYTNKS